MTADAPPVRVAFQGEAGAFSEEAVRAHFGPDRAIGVARRSFQDVTEAIRSGDAELGILPVENRIAGPVIDAQRLIAAERLRVVGEVVLPIRLCLLGVRGTSLESVRRVISHPVALAQCARFLTGLGGIVSCGVYDTAGAAREVGLRRDVTLAAIASRAAAALYDLAILSEDVQDRADNTTRFVIIAAPATPGVTGVLIRGVTPRR